MSADLIKPMFEIVRPVKMHAGETLEVQWFLADGTIHVERYTVPPRPTRDARDARDVSSASSVSSVSNGPDRIDTT